MFVILLALASGVHASEVGIEKRFGVGVELGTSQTVTAKYYVTPVLGVSAHVGYDTYLRGIHGRFQVEQEFVQFADWDWARFALYVNGGIALNGTVAGRYVFNPAVVVGSGLDLQFKPAPASAFLEADLAVYPRAFWDDSIAPLGPIFGVGFRWYF